MGLCKCPRKKVTNLFCFQHKVNVCEHCLVASHPKCVVQSYLRWLRDSDFTSVCQLCEVNLDDDDSGECVRLMCFDVYHWRCLDRYCRSLPDGGDLSQYNCPSCQSHVFPAENVVSPLAEALRTVLSGAGWARPGLGLHEIPSSDYADDTSFDQPQDVTYDPSISYDEEYNMSSTSTEWPRTDNYQNYTDHPNQPEWDPVQHTTQIPNQVDSSTVAHSSDHVITLTANEVDAHMRGGDPPPRYDKATPSRTVATPSAANGLHKVHNVPESHGYDGYGDKRSGVGIRSIDSHFRVTSGAVRPSETGENDDKYKRRTPAIWTRINSLPKFRRLVVTLSTYKLFLLIVFLCLGGFLLLDLFVKYGRTMAEREPFLDPMANPNIRINSG